MMRMEEEVEDMIAKIKERLIGMRRRNLVLLASAIALIVGIVVGYLFSAAIITGVLNLPFISLRLFEAPGVGIQTTTANLSAKVEQYVTANFLAGYGATAKVRNTTVMGSLILMDLDVLKDGNVVSSGEVYATQDGEFIVLGAVYNMSVPLPKRELQPSTQQEVPKSARPNVSLYVMSFCPFGQQAEAMMWPVLDLLEEKFDFELHYVIYSGYCGYGVRDCTPEKYAQYCLDENGNYCTMHGVGEINEDIRQMCIMRNYNRSVWKSYIAAINTNCSYRNVDSCWESVASSLGIDVDIVKDCFENNATSFASAEQALNNQFGVVGSPTLFINGIEYSGSRSAEAYKQAICTAFDSPPVECNVTLGSQSGSASGSCS